MCTNERSSIRLVQVGEREDNDKVVKVTFYEIVFSADLGGSSKYSSGNLEGRSGERFHVNSN